MARGATLIDRGQPGGAQRWPVVACACVGLLVGFPLVVAMPAFTLLLVVVLATIVAVSALRHRPGHASLVAGLIGLLVPVTLYLSLAVAHR